MLVQLVLELTEYLARTWAATPAVVLAAAVGQAAAVTLPEPL